ncbi:cytochrome c3 family protein [Aurantiacibacter sp. MUD61]|uniref:cytochrome c3 family protein n=1 Tax=Aurantiacibacter sp. MUD61 TaxID=3009083 RepID=UPI0022F0303C|nr:cytochrome c3 family protein [Aurantiacibacter sp. MUD61]
MELRIRSIDFTESGREIVREREVGTDAITIGRASENTIHLPDLAIEQTHIVVTQNASGMLEAKAAGTLGFTHDGVHTEAASLDPAKGGELGLGSYLLAFGQGDDGKLTITQRKAAKDDGEAKDRLAGFGLSGALPGKRPMAWAALVAILVVFLAIPIVSHLSRDRVAEPSVEDEGSVMMDASWSTGSLSSVHHGLEDNCEACHTTPFVAVRDESCLTCHEGLGDHAELDRLRTGMPEFTGGEAFLWSVAEAFNKPGPGACTDCHTEHEGAGQMEPTSERFCADCHETMDVRLTDTSLGNAHDFGTGHPQFQALITPARGEEERRTELSADGAHFNGLKFPHDEHLSTTNGVARMAGRLRKWEMTDDGALACSACHTPTADGVRFMPVDMEQSCESCHSLVYDQVGSTFRSLSHGDLDQVRADLLAADRAPRRPVQTGRRRPGQYAEGGIYFGNFSRVIVPTLGNALSDDGVCGECHYRDTSASGALAVHPVVQQTRFFQNGWFDHDAHTQETCVSCHAADTSGDAADLLLPDLESCRDCHLGETALEADVPSSCAMCHSYHPRDSTGAAAPPRIARRER